MQSTHRPSLTAWCPLALLLIGLAMLAGLVRLLPGDVRPWNFAPIGALALYAGARLRGGWAFVVPVAVMAISDYLLWLRWGYMWAGPWVYGSYLLYVVLGRWLRATESPLRIAGATLLASTLFFVITNFGSWRQLIGVPPMNYTDDLAGLQAAFVAAIPFHRPLLAGDVIFTTILFGSHALLSRLYFPAERVAWPAHGEPTA